jgi:hypothetical protein
MLVISYEAYKYYLIKRLERDWRQDGKMNDEIVR